MKRGQPTVSAWNTAGRIISLAAFLLMLSAPSVLAQGSSNMVYLKGHVKHPGEYAISQNPTLYRLLVNYSGLTDVDYRNEVYLARGEIIRTTRGDMGPEIISFNLEDVLNQEPGSDLPLQPQDLVRIYENDVTKAFDSYVWIVGYVKQPGKYELTKNMSLADLLLRAGGFTPEAYMLDCEVSRVELHGIPGDTLNRTFNVQMLNTYNVVQNPEDVLTLIYQGATPASNFKLQPYDQVHVRRSPDVTLPTNVVIEGQVLYPGTYSLERRDETLSEIIDRAGGVTSDAYIAGGQLWRAAEEEGLDATVADLQKEVKEARDEMDLRERAVKSLSAARLPVQPAGDSKSLPLLSSDNRLDNATAEIVEQYEAAIRRYQDARESLEDAMNLRQGMKRINVDFYRLLMKGDKKEDLVLLEGDKIVIPKAPGTVTVLGQVNSPGVYNHVPGKRMDYYIALAGGRTSEGGEAVVTQPSGYSYSLDFLNNPEIFEGAVLRVMRRGPGEK